MDIKIIKADKGYEFIPLVIANILHARLHDVDIVTRNISLNESDPQLLAPIHCSHTTTSHCRIVQVGESDLFGSVYLHRQKAVNQKKVIFRKVDHPWKTELSYFEMHRTESSQSVIRLRFITFFNFYTFALIDNLR